MKAVAVAVIVAALAVGGSSRGGNDYARPIELVHQRLDALT